MKRTLIRTSTLATTLMTAAAAWFVDPAPDGELMASANAQEIQITGPLAGAPAVRHQRLHREGRFDIAPSATFTLLDEFRRGVMPGLRINYHIFDWLGIGVFGGPMFTYNTGLANELQEKAIDNRNCDANPDAMACRLTEVSLCRGNDCLKDRQLGRMLWYVAPQVTVVPFRGKFSLFGAAFLDSDISLFVGAGIVGLNERVHCGEGEDIPLCGAPEAFDLRHRIAAGPTFGLGFNFYPVWTGDDGSSQSWMGFGAEFRSTPFAWNPSGFDSSGAASPSDLDQSGSFPDNRINSADRSLRFNPMLTVYVSFQLDPVHGAEIQVSD